MGRHKRIVVKVGTSSVTHENGTINLRFIDKLCAALTDLKNEGNEVILVTSGAVGVGKFRMNLQDKSLTISEKQAMAAIGQGLLLHIYEKNFLEYGQMSAQLLLTREDIKLRKRFLNARNTILELLKLGVIPIVNENDSVANDEIKFGDNDTLAALVAVLADADIAVLFTDIDGLYTGNPFIDKTAKKIDVVEKINEDVETMAGTAVSKVGTGGMKTKIDAAKIATNAGIEMVIASRDDVKALPEIISGARIGTLFKATHRPLHARKSWILYGSEAEGVLIVDNGAKRALQEKGRSLLPSGIVAVEGDFERGAIVAVADESGHRFAKGISNYSSLFIGRIKGLKTQCIYEKYLDYSEDEVIHRDNLGLM
ncbi:MAG: glutamate 5-kinase [Peptococcaceae bacterium]|nr:glutamate 5-kinase [Peptococcaceae bacterium]